MLESLLLFYILDDAKEKVIFNTFASLMFVYVEISSYLKFTFKKHSGYLIFIHHYLTVYHVLICYLLLFNCIFLY